MWLTAWFFLLVMAASPTAGEPVASASPDHERVVRERAEKIVAALALTNTNLAARVTDRVARQYLDLAAIHAERDARLAAATNDAAATGLIRGDVESRQQAAHLQFLADLNRDLTPDQVERVKDGMTYGVAPLTYGVYLRMFPELTDEQRRQVLAWLHEARELAMVAGTAREKHAVFGKYKGRINNYLVKAGYDLKAGERNLREPSSPGAATNSPAL
ncbi:MAG: DUF3826 domain-containing protein [Limisphaerales bacterium]